MGWGSDGEKIARVVRFLVTSSTGTPMLGFKQAELLKHRLTKPNPL